MCTTHIYIYIPNNAAFADMSEGVGGEWERKEGQREGGKRIEKWCRARTQGWRRWRGEGGKGGEGGGDVPAVVRRSNAIKKK